MGRTSTLSLMVTLALTLATVTAALGAEESHIAMTYKIFCARCHGDEGHGDGPDGSTLSTKPQDFADCAAMSKLTDNVIFNAIKGGGASVGMPADMPSWGEGLSDDQIKGLVQYVRNHFRCKK